MAHLLNQQHMQREGYRLVCSQIQRKCIHRQLYDTKSNTFVKMSMTPGAELNWFCNALTDTYRADNEMACGGRQLNNLSLIPEYRYLFLLYIHICLYIQETPDKHSLGISLLFLSWLSRIYTWFFRNKTVFSILDS